MLKMTKFDLVGLKHRHGHLVDKVRRLAPVEYPLSTLRTCECFVNPLRYSKDLINRSGDRPPRVDLVMSRFPQQRLDGRD